MAYVDGFVVPVPKRKLQAYRRMAQKAGKVWREHGALEYRECVADDVKWGKRTSFPRSVKQKFGETVFFSYIVYKSKADRDRVVGRVMKDKRLAAIGHAQAVMHDSARLQVEFAMRHRETLRPPPLLQALDFGPRLPDALARRIEDARDDEGFGHRSTITLKPP